MAWRKMTTDLHRSSSKSGFSDSVNKVTKQFKYAGEWGTSSRKMIKSRRLRIDFSGRAQAKRTQFMVGRGREKEREMLQCFNALNIFKWWCWGTIHFCNNEPI